MGNDVGGPIGNPLAVVGWASPRNIWSLGIPLKASTDGTDTTPAVTEEFVAEFTVEAPKSVTGVAVFNGSAVAGNLQIQLYDQSGRKMVATASTLQAGTDALQRVPFAGGPVKLNAGTYYIGVQFNNTGARLNTHPVGNGGTVKKTGQTYGTFVNFTPPTTFTTNVGPIAALY